MTVQVSFEDVSFSYDGPLVLEHIDLAIESGEFLGIVGPNGGGKSTLLKIMLGLLEPGAGRVVVLGKSAAEGRHKIGYCPQYISFPRDFPISVEAAVMLGRLGNTRWLGRYRGQDRTIAQEAMAVTELLDLRDRQIATLSGGELQRVLVARALASEPSILVLDEPTANIDLRLEEDIFDLLKKLNKRMTIVVVTHDIGFISEYVTRVACLNRTLVCHQTAAITGDTIGQLYGGQVTMIEHTNK